MSWCFADEAPAFGDKVLEQMHESDLLVPTIWPLEVANVLAVGERRKRLTQASSTHFLELIAGLPIVIDLESPQRAFGAVLNLAREHQLSSYDATYLELAMRQDAVLATLDVALGKAAQSLGIALYE